MRLRLATCEKPLKGSVRNLPVRNLPVTNLCNLFPIRKSRTKAYAQLNYLFM
jgi:hypothetical protein